jgi:4'-phosphopantetheinyl transferase
VTPPAVSSVELDLWILPLAASAADHLCLSDADRRRADRLATATDRSAFVMARAAMRRGLGALTGLSPAAVSIHDRPGRKPDLPDLAEGLDVSFSRSDGLALLAVGRGVRVGVDVEPVRSWDPQLAAVVLSAPELATLEGDPTVERARAFARVWTRKEALLKGVGLGLAVDPRDVTVSTSADPALVTCKVADLSGWALQVPRVDSGWEAAVAVESAGRPISMTIRTLVLR